VTWFASRGAGLSRESVVDGIRIIRRSRQSTVHIYFCIWLKLLDLQRHKFDIIIDQINTIPFFAHWCTATPTVAFVHQLAREVWFYETGRLTAFVGYAMEPHLLSPYRWVPIITDSESSLVSIRDIGLRGNATVIPIAFDAPFVPIENDCLIPQALRLVVTCRLVHSKRVDHALRTVALLHWRGLPVSIDIIGTGLLGPVAHLRNLASVLGIAHIVTFHGRLGNADRDQIIASSFAVVATSAREGWGLSITEANALGIPGAVYPVPGLCDSTIHDQTGVISLEATPPSLADAIERLWNDRDLYLSCRAGARAFAASLSWDRTVDAFEQALLQAVG
jgi:glycosyltransferase involved in cell wall biosynthesis